MLHLWISILLSSDSQLDEARRHLDEVPQERCLSGHIATLRLRALSALDAAK